MLVRGSKFILHLLAATLIGFVLVCGFLVWQLSRGPISIGFLTPYIEEALTQDNAPVRIRLSDTVLAWAGLDRALDVRAVGLDVLADDGRVLASVPEISVRFSVRALLSGLIAPTSLELLGPRLAVVRDADGRFDFNIAGDGESGENGSEEIANLVDALLARPDRSDELGYLTRIGVSSAFVEYEDRAIGLQLVAPRVTMTFERDVEGVRASGSVAIDVAGRPLRFQVSGILSARSGSSEVGLTFADLRPGAIAPLLPDMGFLDGIDIPFDGTIALSFSPDFALEDVGFDIESAGGTVLVPAFFDAPKQLDKIGLRGRARDDFRSVSIDECRFLIAGVPATLNGNVVRRGSALAINLDAGIRKFPVDSIAEWWPAHVASGAREWVTENLADGIVESARVNLSGATRLGQLDAFEVTDLAGRIEATDVTVYFLRPMDPVRGVNAVSTFDQTGFVIDATAGTVRDNRFENARIAIDGLDGNLGGSRINIDVTAAGAVRGAFELLAQEPLNLIEHVEIDAEQASGSHRTQLIVQFPLLENLEFSDVRVAAASSLSEFALERGLFGLPVSDGSLTLQVDPEKMIVDGNIAISGVPAGVAWTEWFANQTATRRTFQVRAIANDAARRKLDIDLAPWITGPVGVGLTYTESVIGVVTGAAEIDLTSATMVADEVGWRKSAGIPGRAFVRFSGDRDRVRRLDRFSITAADLVVDGELGLRAGADGALEPAHVTLDRLAFGGTDIVAAAEFGEDGSIDVSIGGRQLDLRREVAAIDSDDERAPDQSDDARQIRVRVSEAAPLGTVRLGEKTSVTELWGILSTRGRDLRQASLSGKLNGSSALSFEMNDQSGRRDLRFLSDDGGAVIDALDLTDTILGGKLDIAGSIAEAGGQDTFDGQVKLTAFRLTESSSVSRALTLASFSGISDAVAGEGIAIRRAEIPVSATRDRIRIKDAKMRGSDIGVLIAGDIDRGAGTVKLAGEIAPAYTLNSLLGNIPLIGELLTGGGDGIFAASFSVSGSLEDPDVSVNPLTVLTPGIIRRLLTGFGSSENNAAAPSVPTTSDPTIPGSNRPDR